MIIDVVGIDMAFANMGLVRGKLNTTTMQLGFIQAQLVRTEAGDDKKVVRKSSIELRRAKQLRAGMLEFCRGASFAFVEVPSGSQSAAAARALGIAVGVLASCPVPIIEVSPREVKLAVEPGSKGTAVSKAVIIAWAAQRWPDLNWLRAAKAQTTKNGKLPAGRLLDDNEHCADACAAVVAGLDTPEFKQTMSLSHALARPSDLGSSSGGRRVLLL